VSNDPYVYDEELYQELLEKGIIEETDKYVRIGKLAQWNKQSWSAYPERMKSAARFWALESYKHSLKELFRS
jgi:hypothetical protein